MSPMTSIWIIYRAWEKWGENGGTRHGAALAYYAIFSVAPLLLLAIYISGAIFGDDAAKGEVNKQLNAMMPEKVAMNVETMVKYASEPQSSWAPTISMVMLVIAALGAFLHVRNTLCIIWKLDPPEGKTWLGMAWDYLLSILMVFLIATLLLFSLVCSLIVPYLQRKMEERGIHEKHYYHWIEIGISFFLLTILFSVVYRILSGGRIEWGYVWYGSFISAVLFTLGKSLFGFYVIYSDPESMYGATGSVIVFLMWVYYSSQVLFFGAELIQARRTRHEWLYGESAEAQG